MQLRHHWWTSQCMLYVITLLFLFCLSISMTKYVPIKHWWSCLRQYVRGLWKTYRPQHHIITKDLLSIHGIAGADTVASLHGMATVSKIAMKGDLSLSSIGDITAPMNSVILQATKFICVAYCQLVETCTSMTVGHYLQNLCSLPPSNEAFQENVCRCQLQVAIRKAAHGTTSFNRPLQIWLEAQPTRCYDAFYCTCWNKSCSSIHTGINSLQLQSLKLSDS